MAFPVVAYLVFHAAVGAAASSSYVNCGPSGAGIFSMPAPVTVLAAGPAGLPIVAAFCEASPQEKVVHIPGH